MAELDEIIHQPLRLKLMAALHAERNGAALDFSQLKTLSGATDGNLGSHLSTLEKVGYVIIAKDFVGKRPRTQVTATPAGRRAFRRHVEYLRGVVEEAERVGG